MCHVGALSKALGILVRILGPESTDARIFISMKNVSMCLYVTITYQKQQADMRPDFIAYVKGRDRI